MAGNALQLEGNIMLGGTDYSDEISSLVINIQRAVVEIPATFGNAQVGKKAGQRMATLTINFLGDPKDAAGVIEELYTAYLTDSSELTFSANLTTGSTSASNPEWSGTIVVSDLDIGGTVGEHYEQSKTYDITVDGVDRATS